jgi:hypothetical protein
MLLAIAKDDWMLFQIPVARFAGLRGITDGRQFAALVSSKSVSTYGFLVER